MFLSYLLFVASCLILRISLVLMLGWQESLKQGFFWGVYFDLLVGFIPWILSGLLSFHFSQLRKAFILIFATFVWLSTLTSTLYYFFFEDKLTWWIITQHFQDLGEIQGSTSSLLDNVWIFFSLAVFVFFILTVIKSKLITISKKRPFIIGVLKTSAQLVTLIALMTIPNLSQGYIKSLPRNYRANEYKSIVYDQVLIRLVSEWRPKFRQNKKPTVEYSHIDSAEAQNPHAHLNSYFQHEAPSAEQRSLESKKWRKLLDLPERGPINVVLFFVESFRAYELLHPTIGPQVYPHLLDAINKHGLLYEQTYSSALLPGQTVRGMFTTQCSFMDDFLGGATYRSNPMINVRCLGQILSENGYNTMWFPKHPIEFHNKGIFESNHGIKEFYPRETFIPIKDIPERFLNLKDSISYPALEKKMKTVLPLKEPFYTHTINLGTHHPFALHPEVELGSLIDDQFKPKPTYRSYLQSVKVWDSAFTKTLLSLMKEKWAHRTIFIVIADHSVPNILDSKLGSSSLVTEEKKFRIPLIIFSKGLNQGLRFKNAIHQADLAPTLLNILNINGKHSFQGKSLPPIDAPGTPWIFSYYDRRSSWRDPTQLCHNTLSGARCYALKSDEDPFFIPNPAQVGYDSEKAFTVQKIAELISLVLKDKSKFPTEKIRYSKE